MNMTKTINQDYYNKDLKIKIDTRHKIASETWCELINFRPSINIFCNPAYRKNKLDVTWIKYHESSRPKTQYEFEQCIGMHVVEINGVKCIHHCPIYQLQKDQINKIADLLKPLDTDTILTFDSPVVIINMACSEDYCCESSVIWENFGYDLEPLIQYEIPCSL